MPSAILPKVPSPESEIQEFVDHLVREARMVKFARTPEYNELFLEILSG